MGSVVKPEDVLESLMKDGTIDAIRMKIINKLKANDELKGSTITMVEQSKVLNTPGAEKQTKRQLFDALRRELEEPVLEKASKSVWELILDSNGLGKEISEIVEKVFRRLSGHKPPHQPLPHPVPPPPPLGDIRPQNQKENNEIKERKKVIKDKKAETSTRKRTFTEMNTRGEAAADDRGDNSPVVSSDGGKTLSTKPKI